MRQPDDSEVGGLEAERIDGQRAEALLKDETLLKMFARAEAVFLKALRAGTTTAARDDAWYRLQALEQVHAELRATVGSGQMAERRLATKQPKVK